jgi:hypothetical protein
MIVMAIENKEKKRFKGKRKIKRISPNDNERELYGLPKNWFDKTDSYFDLEHIIWSFILLGVVLLITFILFFISSATVPSESIWDDSFTGQLGTFGWVLPLSLLLILVGGILYFFYRQFSKLAEFAAEVESGEFEEKVLKELDDD